MLDIYCPVQWEFARLNVSQTVTSKRKILNIIESKIVEDWDDPRLFTIAGLKRRGVPPQVLYTFCERNSVTMAQAIMSPLALDAAIRDYFNQHAPRRVAIIDPLKVNIKNFDEFFAANPSVPKICIFEDLIGSKELKKDSKTNERKFELKPEIYIDSNDFSDVEKSTNFR